MHVNLYVDQVAKLNSYNLEDNRVFEQVMRENAVMLRVYENERIDGTLPKKFNKQGNEVEHSRALELECYSRRIHRGTAEFLANVRGTGMYYVGTEFPGVQKVNFVTKTFDVQITKEDFIRNRTQPMKIGKYFRRLGRHTDNEVNVMTNKIISEINVMLDAELQLATGEDIAEIYINGPNSCMSGESYEFSTDGLHPALVYDSPDLACAYVEINGRIVARAMVNLIENQYSTMYGNSELLGMLLSKEGYDSGYLDGCRVKKIPCNGTYLMPYIDGSDEVGDEDEEYFIIGSCGYRCTNTNGLVEDGIACAQCGDHFDPDYDGIFIDNANQAYCCTSCAETDGWRFAEDTDEFHAIDDLVFVQSENSYYYCTDDLVLIDDEWYLEDDEDIVYSEDQDEFLIQCDAVWIDSIDSWVSDCREDEFEDLEDEAA